MELPDDIVQISLDEMRQLFEAGDKNQLFKAIRMCGQQQVVMPEWVVKAFFEATNEWYSMRVKTLDEAFGLMWPKGKSLPATKKKRDKQYAVYHRVQELNANGDPIDEHLFRVVGGEFNISGSLASDYYYGVKNFLTSK